MPNRLTYMTTDDYTLHNALYLLQLFFSGKINSKQGGYIAVGGLYITPGYCEMQPPYANKGENSLCKAFPLPSKKSGRERLCYRGAGRLYMG